MAVTTGHAKVLVVDDEPAIRRSMEITLKAEGYRVVGAATGEDALDISGREHPDLVILDLGLPGISGHEVISGLRAWTQIPILVLSARIGEAEKVRALEAGADDYVTKPFGMAELVARVRAAIRRGRLGHDATSEESPLIATDDFEIDLTRTEVRRAGQVVRLTPTEWHLVEALVRRQGRMVSQKALLQEVWGPEYGEESNYLRVFMAQIRSKLEPTPPRPRYFHTEPGLGYRFEDRGRAD
jgi:two-component system KDP operon response regulator KdpE